MNFQEKKYNYPLPIYRYDIYIIVSTDINKSRKKRDKEIGREWQDDITTRALHSSISDRPISYIFMPADAGIDDMAHEGTHCLQRIIEWIGATYQDAEFVAYLMGYIVVGISDCVSHFNKNILKNG